MVCKLLESWNWRSPCNVDSYDHIVRRYIIYIKSEASIIKTISRLLIRGTKEDTCATIFLSIKYIYHFLNMYHNTPISKDSRNKTFSILVIDKFEILSAHYRRSYKRGFDTENIWELTQIHHLFQLRKTVANRPQF